MDINIDRDRVKVLGMDKDRDMVKVLEIDIDIDFAMSVGKDMCKLSVYIMWLVNLNTYSEKSRATYVIFQERLPRTLSSALKKWSRV